MLNGVELVEVDTVIVGGGGAALRAAIECLKAGQRTLLVMKSVAGQSHTLMAEGGINATTRNQDESDGWERHFNDTMESGRYINHRKMVEMLCRESPARCYDLFDFGADFRKDENGRLIQAHVSSGGQRGNRVISQGDFIGFIVQRALMAEALRLRIQILDETICIKCLLDEQGRVRGTLSYSLKECKFVAIQSASVILACGGGGRVFRVTTNPLESTGDGYLIGFDAGVELRDLEMIQFHPTALCGPSSAEGILVTEMCRALGGRLYNVHNERFMERYDSRLELATRDIVARAIFSEIGAGRGTENGGVYLDLSAVKPVYLAYALENTARVVKTYQGIDIMKSRIEVRPAAHHFMGGLVAKNPETMEAIDGLFVAGEVAWGTHGANRLGGNSLAETQVFGFRAGLGAVSVSATGRYQFNEKLLRRELDGVAAIFRGDLTSAATVYSVRRGLRLAMDQLVGVIRTQQSLNAAEQQLVVLEAEFAGCRKMLDNYHSFAHILECANMLRLARLIVSAATFREESRGAHFRADFPEESSRVTNTSIHPNNPARVVQLPCDDHDYH